ncbi:MAG: DUF4112 domain-containing protein [Alphaproteobacteria bacterium]|nr:DUF4112 domain-containing protein [Alphaproteobacteria bacterium]
MPSGSSPADEDALLADAERLADWLDRRFVLPGTRIRFGFDSLLGLVPGIGDSLTAAIGVYVIVRAHEAGAPPLLLLRMGGNLLLDALVGSIPLLGDAFDVVFKANARNARLLRRHVERRRSRMPS